MSANGRINCCGSGRVVGHFGQLEEIHGAYSCALGVEASCTLAPAPIVIRPAKGAIPPGDTARGFKVSQLEPKLKASVPRYARFGIISRVPALAIL